MFTKEMEEYLEAIFKLTERKKEPTKTGDLAQELGVTPSSTTEMIQKLARKKLVQYKPYQGITLTKKGKETALKLVRRHRLSERLLTDLLGVEWENVHEEACKLEHIVSGEIEDHLEKTLEKPDTCPHGNPIPTAKGKLPTKTIYRLSEIEPPAEVDVEAIEYEAREILQHLASLGILPGIRIKVLEKTPFRGPIIVQVENSEIALGNEVATAIRVSPT